MKAVKTYNQVDNANEKATFAISKMEDIYEKHGGVTDDPHRHDYFTVLVVRSAKGIHKIDFNSYDLAPFQVFFVAPGQVHQVIEEQASRGYVMTFSTQFLVENSIPLSFIDGLNLFHDYGQSPS
ncbi:MAG: AraC family ligand binding domain-containing protein, partial [Flavobacteriales bacterium]|nr:AraC family ligand binding domain-containing protein [Flavobacteriales bacterium]